MERATVLASGGPVWLGQILRWAAYLGAGLTLAMLCGLVLTAPTAASAATPAPAQPGATLGAGPKVTVEMIGQTLPTHLQHKKVDQPYTQEIIPKRSNGRVEVKLSTWAEKNLSGNEFIRLLRRGQVDVVAGTFTYLSGDVPLLDMADLAGLNPTIEQLRKVLAATQPAFNQELERLGVRQIAPYAFPAQVFFFRQAIKGLDDARGKKMRTFGTTLNDLVTALGAQAVSITFAEVYSALERGVVDGAITGAMTANTTKWYEVTSHMYTLPVAWAPGAYYVNLDWWNKLDPEVRRFLEANLAEMAEKQTELAEQITQDGIECNAGRPTCKEGVAPKDRPMTEVKPMDADRARLKQVLEKSVIPAWVKRAGEKNGDVYNQVVAPISGVRYSRQ
jgi:TRAP-type transport system periplasmic protein